MRLENRELPLLSRYEHLTLSEIQHKIRSLTVRELEKLLKHEESGANRAPVLQIIKVRLEAVKAGAALNSDGASSEVRHHLDGAGEVRP